VADPAVRRGNILDDVVVEMFSATNEEVGKLLTGKISSHNKQKFLGLLTRFTFVAGDYYQPGSPLEPSCAASFNRAEELDSGEVLLRPIPLMRRLTSVRTVACIHYGVKWILSLSVDNDSKSADLRMKRLPLYA
jgi:hypothetical protein